MWFNYIQCTLNQSKNIPNSEDSKQKLHLLQIRCTAMITVHLLSVSLVVTHYTSWPNGWKRALKFPWIRFQYAFQYIPLICTSDNNFGSVLWLLSGFCRFRCAHLLHIRIWTIDDHHHIQAIHWIARSIFRTNFFLLALIAVSVFTNSHIIFSASAAGVIITFVVSVCAVDIHLKNVGLTMQSLVHNEIFCVIFF